jgi:hypothetical protein
LLLAGEVGVYKNDLVLGICIGNMGLGVEGTVLSTEIGNEELVSSVIGLLLESFTSDLSGWWS